MIGYQLKKASLGDMLDPGFAELWCFYSVFHVVSKDVGTASPFVVESVSNWVLHYTGYT